MKKTIISFILALLLVFASCASADVGDSSFSTGLDNESQNSSSTSSSSEKEDSSGDGGEDEFLYNDFTYQEKQLFIKYIGEVIPFVPNNEYYLEGYYYTDDFEHGINFYTVGNSVADFTAYLEKFVGYELTNQYLDEYDDLWYCYEKKDIVIDLAYYYDSGEYYIDLYVYSDLSTDLDDDPWGDSSSGDLTGGNENGGEDEGELLTNVGKGLPKSVNGIFDVDFTKAKYVKNVTEQGYYLDGCPTLSTTKDPAILVIPVEFSDVKASTKGFSTDKIEKGFNGTEGQTDYYSVRDYYFKSSYGKLDLDITVYGEWFQPKYSSSYYKNKTIDYYGSQIEIGDQMIMDEALAFLENKMDLSAFDSDGNAIIDAVIMINTLEIDQNSNFNWAYRYWNIYTDENDYYYEYDGVSANDYLWASYEFLFESADENGNLTYGDQSLTNTYTYIHETAHVLGADDYYDTAGIENPLDGLDIMDSMHGDHNPYTKFNYGWLTSSKLIVAENDVTVCLQSFAESGDSVLIANDWDEDLGVYQEYFIVVYYTNSGLNGGEFGYFSREGIVVYHVNASLIKDVYDGETYYDVYNTNTHVSDKEYGTENNLIEFVKTSNGTFTYTVGDSLSSSVKTDGGAKIAYTFEVLSIDDFGATLKFSKNA